MGAKVMIKLISAVCVAAMATSSIVMPAGAVNKAQDKKVSETSNVLKNTIDFLDRVTENIQGFAEKYKNDEGVDADQKTEERLSNIRKRATELKVALNLIREFENHNIDGIQKDIDNLNFEIRQLDFHYYLHKAGLVINDSDKVCKTIKAIVEKLEKENKKEDNNKGEKSKLNKNEISNENNHNQNNIISNEEDKEVENSESSTTVSNSPSRIITTIHMIKELGKRGNVKVDPSQALNNMNDNKPKIERKHDEAKGNIINSVYKKKMVKSNKGYSFHKSEIITIPIDFLQKKKIVKNNTNEPVSELEKTGKKRIDISSVKKNNQRLLDLEKITIRINLSRKSKMEPNIKWLNMFKQLTTI